jgi:hypothetical protein
MRRVEEVVVFTGEEALTIGLPLFLMHPAIENLDGKGIAQMYQATQVYASLIESNREGLSHISDEYLNRVKRGAGVLEDLIIDLNGERIGGLIIQQTLKTILEANGK